MAICHEQNFVGTNHYYYFHLPIGPFHCTKFKKKFLQQILSYEDAPFWAKNGPFAPNFFLEKIIIIFILLFDSLIVQDFKKILTADPEL